MCLYLSSYSTSGLRSSLQKKGKMTFFKTLSVVNGKLVTPIMDTPVPFKTGWFVSDRHIMKKTTDLTAGEYFWKTVLCGIHVHRLAPPNVYEAERHRIVVEVTGYARHFIAANEFYAAFTRIYITKKAIQKAIDAANKIRSESDLNLCPLEVT